MVIHDAMASLRIFFARFPTYRKNDLYLSGHGYAAVYQAKLAKAIIDENNDPYIIYNDNFKLKGILLGNPCINPDECHASGT
jgi:serine carboxypeptidase-like clade II